MLKSIKAEFSEFDLAESASRKIRKNTDGIRKIKISSQCSAENLNSNQYSFHLLATAVTTQNYITMPVISSADNSSNIPRKAVLDIICTEECSSKVHNILTSMGGINISAETFIP